MTFLNALLSHNEKKSARFHTPGHSGNSCSPLFNKYLQYDLTELPDTGCLYDGFGHIYESEVKTSNLFSSKRTLYSAGGCSLCIQTMLMLLKKNNIIFCCIT